MFILVFGVTFILLVTFAANQEKAKQTSRDLQGVIVVNELRAERPIVKIVFDEAFPPNNDRARERTIVNVAKKLGVKSEDVRNLVSFGLYVSSDDIPAGLKLVVAPTSQPATTPAPVER